MNKKQFTQRKSYIRQVNFYIEYFLRHYGKPGDRQFRYYQKARPIENEVRLNELPPQIHEPFAGHSFG